MSQQAIMPALRDLLREHVNAFDQSDLMRGVNNAFGKDLDGRFTTLPPQSSEYCCETRQLVFANAGHPPAL